MEANYTANMYLTPNDLNKVEDKIEELTLKVQEKIYNNSTSPLRPIEVGDNLNGKTLYLSFPRNIYELIGDTSSFVKIVEMSNSVYHIDIRGYSNSSNIRREIFFHKSTQTFYEYIYDYLISINKGETIYNKNPSVNRIKITLPNDVGTITAINNNDICQYIQIYEDETIIPDYDKYEWFTNEIPYIQQINHIEQGIENIGKYFTKPVDWINTKIWLNYLDFSKDTVNYSNTNGTAIASFSYIDINRWIHNLNLIEQEDMENVTIWNTNKSEYYWNEEDD